MGMADDDCVAVTHIDDHHPAGELNPDAVPQSDAQKQVRNMVL